MALTWVAETYRSGAAMPSNRTVVPASWVAMLPVEASTAPKIPAAGPSIEPTTVTSSPGDTAPPTQLAEFATPVMTTGEGADGFTVKATVIIWGLFEAPAAVIVTALM